MTSFAKTIATAALAFSLASGPALAGQIPASVTPVGTWQMASGEATLEVVMCGDGTQICATLTWLRDDMRTPENLAYLNKLVVDGAVKAGPVKWKGAVTYEGETYAGSISMTSSHSMKMYGCVGVACESMVLKRI